MSSWGIGLMETPWSRSRARGAPRFVDLAFMPTSALLRGIGRGWKTSSQTTTRWGQTGSRSTTIVLAVHPWQGETVEVLQSYGDRAVWVEHENGDRRIIPVSWTSLVPVISSQLRDGRTIRISPQAAIDLSRWVSSRLEGKHGIEP